MESLSCPHSDSCAGCSEWKTAYELQLDKKIAHLTNGLKQIGLQDQPPIQVKSVGPAYLRDRLDFGIEDGRLGLYSKKTQGILDLPDCFLLTPTLQEFYTDFRKIKWPLKKASFRLRVSPTGERGAWLDFSNLDIKTLLEEKKSLLTLSEFAFVEIGQRRKSLKIHPDRLSLGDPVLKNWTQSQYLNQSIPLYSTVGSFSQTGHAANQVITSTVARMSDSISYSAFFEYGAGNGNLTFPAMKASPSKTESSPVLILETDKLALESLEKAAKEQSLNSQIKILQPKIVGTQLSQSEFWNSSKIEMILANPPRSGLNEFLQKIAQVELENLPRHFIYMSCYPESFFQDSVILNNLKYRLKEIEIIDQFPQSTHYEIISHWETS